MTVTLINPDGYVRVPLYHHVAVATGSKHVHIAGQVAWDEHGKPVAPDDPAGQVAQVYRNVAKSLAAAGATFADVVRFTWYAVDWQKEKGGVPGRCRPGDPRARAVDAAGGADRRGDPLRARHPHRGRGHRGDRLTLEFKRLAPIADTPWPHPAIGSRDPRPRRQRR